jgi:hypothetical protein
MRDETSIRTAARCNRSPLPPRSTVKGSEFPLTPSKQETKPFLIYGKPGLPIFRFAAPARHRTPPHSSFYSKNTPKINRQPELLESRVSRSQQTTSQKSIANFQKVRVSHFQFSLLHFPILIATVPGLEFPVTHRNKGTSQFLIATRTTMSSRAEGFNRHSSLVSPLPIATPATYLSTPEGVFLRPPPKTLHPAIQSRRRLA